VSEEQTPGAVLVTVTGHVMVITINRPERRNAINGEVARGIDAALARCDADPEVRAAVLTGAGPVFSAGADLKMLSEGRRHEAQTRDGGFAGIVRRVRRTPLIAAVDGLALAGGCEIVLACDLVVASTNAGFGLPEVKRSLVAAAGGAFRLLRAVPERVAVELLLTGDPISAQRAYELGLVNTLTEPGAALPAATQMAEVIAGNAPLAVAETLDIVRLARSDEDRLWRASNEAMARLMETEDGKEGSIAFLEKRPPIWRGR
jgi:enoyl-CoA hydratase